ncbi:MAG: DUF2298 domain-containing protein [Thermomicrobiales bacterium]|nr:DUF2298 domain-containing protein [Thermomicrobiales bacterium]
MKSHRLPLSPYTLALLATFLLAALLRIYGMNWDQGLYLHPDERFIAIVSSERVDLPKLSDLGALFDPATSPINPRRDGPDGNPLSFAYGTLPVYVQSVASWAINLVADDDYQSYQDIYRVGRPLTVLVDMTTLLVVYLLARRLAGRYAGLIAAMLYGTAVLPIQLSHFFTVDTWLTLFVTTTLYFAIRFADKRTIGRAVALGVPVGCAFATKASVAALLLPLAVVGLSELVRAIDRRVVLGQLALAGLVALAVFTVFEPYAIVRSGPFFKDISTQADIVRGHFDVPFTRQFIGLTPGLYEARNLFLYGLGPAFLLAGLVAIAWAARHGWRRRDLTYVVLLSWVAGYGLTIFLTEARFMRYSLPMIPVLAVLIGAMLGRPLPARSRLPRALATATILIVTAIWGFGFVSIYSHENSRIAASRWMYENIPSGSAISVETWDDALPLPYPGAPQNTFTTVSFDMYGDLPPDDKVAQIAGYLQSVDYVVLSSDRLTQSVDNEPWRYAVQIDYYRRLDAGQLGFQLVYEGVVDPQLFGLRLNDARADESFTVYDHPHVRIYRKVESLSTDEIRNRLLWGASQPWYPMRYLPSKDLMLGVPASDIETTQDAGWNSLATSSTPAAILLWILAIEMTGLAILPVAAQVFRTSPDRGAWSARLIGILLVAWLVWIGASLDFWPARSVTVAVAIAFVAVLAWGWYAFRISRRYRVELPSVRSWLVGSAIWIGVFSFFLLLRAIYPDFWQTWFGGEKPFELAYLRAISRSTSFPSYDPWFSGGIINYYYYGWHIIASLIKLTGVGVSLGFQLGVATIPALLALQTVAFVSLCMQKSRRWMSRNMMAIGALVAVVAVVIVGNLDALVQVIQQRSISSTTFDFWRSTRVIDFTINEFPYFSALWADLHPHFIDLPVIMLVLTLVAVVVLSAERMSLATVPTFGLMALALGTTAVTNSWDAPLCAGLILGGCIWVAARSDRDQRISIIGSGLLTLVVAYVMFRPFFSRFYSVVGDVTRTNNGSPLSQFLAVWGIFLAIIAIAIVVDAVQSGNWQSPIRQNALALGVTCLVAGTLAFVVMAVRGNQLSAGGLAALWIAAVLLGIGSLVHAPSRFGSVGIGLAFSAAVATGAISGYRPAAAVAMAVGVVALGFVIRLQPARSVPWVIVGVGSALLVGVEVIYVADDLSGGDWQRMNTVFKFYNQAWLLLASGAALLLVDLAFRSTRSLEADGDDVSDNAAEDGSRSSAIPDGVGTIRVAIVVGIAVLALGLLYPLLGTPSRLAQDMPSSPDYLTLDGYAWMNGGSITNATGDEIQFSGDLAAIEWLNDRAEDNPVLLEASIGPYRGNGSRISSATGLPTVLGWDRHQRQQRYPAGIDRRMSDIREIYNTTDAVRKLELLRSYDVRYVIVVTSNATGARQMTRRLTRRRRGSPHSTPCSVAT